MPAPKRRPTKRPILYKQVSTSLCLASRDKPLTCKQAKKLFDWQEETTNVKFSDDYLLRDRHNTKIRCCNNLRNRPLYPQQLSILKQEILRGKWRCNGEPIIIGKTGLILNGQHTLAALILAVQAWEMDPTEYPYWEQEPTIDKIIIFGIDEDDETVNTMDTCKPRSLADVLFRSEHFKSVKSGERKTVARICSYAINTIWERTGASHAFASYQTHQESMSFLNRHPRVVNAVNHIYLENGGDNTIGHYLPPGYAAGMLYLMGVSKSEPREYIADPQESSLDFSNWDKAEDFFTLLANEDSSLEPIKLELRKRLDDDDVVNRRERLALIAEGWNKWTPKKKITRLSLRYEMKDGLKVLVDEPSVGGIDLIEHSKEDL